MEDKKWVEFFSCGVVIVKLLFNEKWEWTVYDDDDEEEEEGDDEWERER